MTRDLNAYLTSVGQQHLISVLEGLGEPAARQLRAEIEAIDWELVRHPAETRDLTALSSCNVTRLDDRHGDGERIRAAGRAAYERGEVGAIMVAGGQGTRLGYPGPKGCYTVWPLTGRTPYRIFAEKVLAASRRYGTSIPFLVMTSPHTHEETQLYFSQNDFFGLAPGQVRFFQQGDAPTLDREGRAMLASADSLLKNPDGHGGCVLALERSGELARAMDAGIRYLVYIQVDNILAPIDDPFLVGQMAEGGSEMVTKVVKKAGPDERVGNLAALDGRDCMVEYTELTPEQSRAVDRGGELLFAWGNTAMHGFQCSFLKRSCAEGVALRFHRSMKKVQAWSGGQSVELEGIKNELFIFDLIPIAAHHCVLEVLREAEFAPLKNAAGTDSPESVRTISTALFHSWISSRGLTSLISPNAHIEISPLYADTQDAFAAIPLEMLKRDMCVNSEGLALERK